LTIRDYGLWDDTDYLLGIRGLKICVICLNHGLEGLWDDTDYLLGIRGLKICVIRKSVTIRDYGLWDGTD
jgi:hypothetical protein